MNITYIKDVDIASVLEFSADNLTELRHAVDSTLKTIEGLRSGALQNDTRSAMIAAELIAGLRDKVEDCIARIVVDLVHSDKPPATNAIARAVGLSVTRVKAISDSAEELPEDA